MKLLFQTTVCATFGDSKVLPYLTACTVVAIDFDVPLKFSPAQREVLKSCYAIRGTGIREKDH